MQEKRIIEEFKRREKLQFIVGGVGIVLILLLFLLGLELFSIVLILALLIFTWNNWNYSNWNKYFGKRGNSKVCPNCGAKLVKDYRDINDT